MKKSDTIETTSKQPERLRHCPLNCYPVIQNDCDSDMLGLLQHAWTILAIEINSFLSWFFEREAEIL